MISPLHSLRIASQLVALATLFLPVRLHAQETEFATGEPESGARELRESEPEQPTVRSSPTRRVVDEDGPVGGSSAIFGSNYATEPQYIPSSEGFTLELRVGTYEHSALGNAGDVFRGDLGPFLGAELDVHVIRVPYLGPFALGASFGWAEFTGPANVVGSTSNSSAGETGLSLFNLNVLAMLRVDALAREFEIPLIVTPKLGPDFGYIETGADERTAARVVALGLRWAVQFAFELDILDQRAARTLDDEWSINHTALFFEIFGSTIGAWDDSQIDMSTDVSWQAGLQATF